MKLYSYFRSSAAYRVRIALNLKGLPYEMVPIHLTKDGGQQRKPEFRAVNPQMRVPALELSSGEVLTQSLAIIEYLDDIHPEPPLLPADALERAKVRAIAQMVACDIHPLNNLVALQYLKRHAQARAAGDRRLVPSLGDRGLHRDRSDDRARALCLRRACDARRHLPGAAGVQCAAVEGAARSVSRKSSRSTPPA